MMIGWQEILEGVAIAGTAASIAGGILTSQNRATNRLIAKAQEMIGKSQEMITEGRASSERLLAEMAAANRQQHEDVVQILQRMDRKLDQLQEEPRKPQRGRWEPGQGQRWG
jgi:uncharacterized membrane protein